MNLSELLRQISAVLQPDPVRVAEARGVAQKLAAAIQRDRSSDMLLVRRVIQHGSISRDTALRHFDDVDVLVEFDEDALATTRGTPRTPSDTIKQLRAAVERQRRLSVHLGDLEVRPQDHSVGVTYINRGYRVDLVPALRSRAGRLRVPERSTGTWVPCHPNKISSLLKVADSRGVARPAIRLMKAWRGVLGKERVAIPSYAIELWVIQAVQRMPEASVDDVIFHLIDALARHHLGHRLDLLGGVRTDSAVVCIDPATNSNVTWEMQVADRKNFVDAARMLRDALQAAGSVSSFSSRSGLATTLRGFFLAPTA